MDYLELGDKIDYDTYNGLVYLLRKFKRLTSDLKISKTISSDYGDYTITGGLTSVGGNFILEDDVTISSGDVLRNCFYTFVFTIVDVNLSGTVNKRIVKVTGDTGDNGVLEVVLEPSLLESDEVLLPEFSVDIVFDPHEYYTPVSVLDITLESDKRFVVSGEVATVTATVLDTDGEPLEGLTLQFNVNGVLYSRVTDENGQIFYEYTGTGVSSRVVVSVSGESLTIYDTPMIATVTGGSVRLGQNMVATGDILIDWGDGTTITRQSGNKINSSHTYTDGLNEHTICFVGEITSLGEHCFSSCTGLTSITIPNTVTSLGQGCFFNCTDLTSVIIPNSVTSLGEHCFSSCTGLTSVIIPNSVTSLGEHCFSRCTGLTSVIIPNSVTSLGNYCFYGCSSLVDYQLYWKDSAILEYNARNIPVNSNTYFTIPQGQRNQYLSKHYPNKIKIRGYDITLSTDKTIITEDETSTVTATLTYNMEPATDKTVSYTIKQGATVIDTGTDTTDSNGQIEIEYTGTSAGKITIQITYDTLTETTIIYDSITYDNATTTDHNDIWTHANTVTLTRNTTESRMTDSQAEDWGYLYLAPLPVNSIIEFDYLIEDGESYAYFWGMQKNPTGYINGSGVSLHKGNINTWYHMHIEVYNNHFVATSNDRDRTYSFDDLDEFIFFLWTSRSISALRFKNFKVYNMGGSSKVDTSISISSDKASYYTDESIILSGSLTDEDDLPLVNADVKVYRGASLVDTVSTDSTGTYEKSVTGLSAGSYSFKAVYDGDDTYQDSTSSTVSVIVQNHSYSLSIASDKQSILTTESVTITGTLLMDSSGYSGQSIQLYEGSTLIDTLTTDSNGNYSKTISGLTAGTHTFKAVNSNAESSTVSVTVTEPTPVHDYSLTLASTKNILSYADSESATITATLTDNSVAVAGETLNYVIKHGSSTIDSGSDTTDANGEISFTYSATGVGDVTIEVDYGIFLQETFVIQDLQLNDPLTSNSGHWTIPSGANVSFNTNGMVLGASSSWKDIYLEVPITKPSEIEYEVVSWTGTNSYHLYFFDSTKTNRLFQLYKDNSNHTVLDVYSSYANYWNSTIPQGTSIKVRVLSDTMELYVNGELKVSKSYTMTSPFIIGVITASNRTTTYKNLKIKAL